MNVNHLEINTFMTRFSIVIITQHMFSMILVHYRYDVKIMLKFKLYVL